ncbi:MAG: hydrogenase maturation protease [Syntrophotaleaceae bacterium]
MKTLILGIGNLLLTDEGIGVHVARALSQETLPPDVTVLEIGTAFLEALPQISVAERIIIVDAMEGDHAPGTVYRVPFDDCLKPKVLASLHGFDLSRVLYMAGRSNQPEAVVIGVEPESIAWGIEPSVTLQQAMPTILKAVRAEMCR